MKNTGSSPWLKIALAASVLGNVALGVALAVRSAPGEAAAETAARDASSRPAPPAPSANPPAASSALVEAQLSRELKPYAALGTYVAENNKIPALRWTPQQFEAFQIGLRSSYEGRGFAVDDDAKKLREEINAKVQAMLGAKQSNPIDEYFASLREKEGVLPLESGLHYRITQEGTGEMPHSESTVLVSYSARLPGGKALPSLSRARVRSRVKDLLPGMAEGVQLLTAGAKALVYLPPALSFGSGAWPEGVPQGAPIIFFLELHEVVDE